MSQANMVTAALFQWLTADLFVFSMKRFPLYLLLFVALTGKNTWNKNKILMTHSSSSLLDVNTWLSQTDRVVLWTLNTTTYMIWCYLLSHTELRGLQVRSGLQEMVPLPFTCCPFGQVTRTDCPTWNFCWDAFPLLSSLQPGGGRQDFAVRNRNHRLISQFFPTTSIHNIQIMLQHWL